MKKMLLIIAMFSFALAGEMGLSTYGALNMASIKYDPTNSDAAMKPGLVLGVNYNKLPVVLGVGISMRGDKVEGTGYKMTNSYTYLDLSAIYPYEVGPGRVWGGLGIGVNLSAKSKVEYSGATATAMGVTSAEADVTDVEMDYGLLFGYTYPVTEVMGVYASYYMGLAEIVKDSKAKHGGIGVGFTYDLPL